ncbi:SRPBCC family protein [Streptomyces sp. PT12]|uniref:SRPBCC family protein n=1 Tax=Streptomyces sp. PT12 TaxID=1510197 RepID=UPI000DE379FA|nr:SRPBCC family protein [Streptomyces sp. PT12]RBM10030.1 polyketide cyclase/dehydrase [Streptomyces sp. PT12]
MNISSSLRRPVVKVAIGIVVVAAAVGIGVSVADGGDSDEVARGADAATTAPPTAQEDECGGMTIDHSAPITRSTEILIDAPIDRVWDVQTDVENWGEWQEAVQTIERLDEGPFTSESQFRWTTPVPESEFSPADTLTITSSMQRLEPGRCLLWQGPAIGESVTIDEGVHLWTFTETDGGTLVRTEESWDSELLASLEGADLDAVAALLGGGLDVWLSNLKAEAESAS